MVVKLKILVPYCALTYFEDIDGDSNTDQGQEDESQQCSISVHHTITFRTSSTASKESDNHHNNTNDDQHDGGVQVGVSKEV